MTNSTKDKVGGHFNRELAADGQGGFGAIVWSAHGRKYAKRWKSRQMRRNSRQSIRFMVQEANLSAWEDSYLDQQELEDDWSITGGGYDYDYDYYEGYLEPEYDEPYYDPWEYDEPLDYGSEHCSHCGRAYE